MAADDRFKQRIDQLVNEFKETDEFQMIQKRSQEVQHAFEEDL
jgi:hypothetical protein